MEKVELKHLHVSPDVEEQRSILEDSRDERLRHLQKAKDILIDMRDCLRRVRSLANDYLELDTPLNDRFSYYLVSGLADDFSFLINEYLFDITNLINDFERCK